ncbi:MAG: alpha/beta hydrolase [Hyphomicrobiales bacterium]
MGSLAKSILWIALIYICVCGFMFFFQRKLQYFPNTEWQAPSLYNLKGAEDIQLKTADGETVHGWFAHPSKPGMPVILYFHGNAEAIQNRWERAQLFSDTGYGYFMLSYRGFGGSSGNPTEEGLMRDADAALAFLEEQGFEHEHLVYWGESLGSGVALQLAAKSVPAAIVLEAPFTSAANVARTRYWFLPVGTLMKDQFNSIDYIEHLQSPAFVFHGDRDLVVPFYMGKEVHEKIPTEKEFYQVSGGGHVDPLTLPLWQAIDAFLQKHK